MKDPIRILLVDDSPYFLEAARDFLHFQGTLSVVGMAVEEQQAIAQTRDLKPDVILLDLNLGRGSGLRLIPILKENLPGARVIVLTMMEEAGYREAAMLAGADGFVSKSAMSNTLVSAILDALERARTQEPAPNHCDGAGHAEQTGSRFLRLAKHLPDLIYRYELEPTRGFSYVSPSAVALTGYTPEEHYADPELGFKLVHPQDRHILETIVRGGVEFGKPVVLRWVRKDGRVIWTEQRNVGIHDETGKLTAIEGIARDITEQKQAEANANIYQRRYRALFEQEHDAVFILDLEGRHVDANERAAQMMGYSLDELRKLTFRDSSAEAEKSRETMQRLLAGEKVPTYERLFRKKTGEVFPVEINVELVRDVEGNPLHFQSIVRDITERKRLEREREEVAQRNASLITALGQIVYEWRPFTDELIWEGDYTSILGYTAEEMGTTTESWTSRIHPDDLERALGEVDAVIRGKRIYDQEYRFLHRDGTYRWMRDSGVVHLRPGGELERIIGVFSDISERKRSEEALKASERFARESLDSLTAHIAILDETGEIVAVNRSWREFAQANGEDPAQVSEGVNYLSVCDAAAGKDSEEAAVIAECIRAVMRGEKETCSVEYPCHSPEEKRWFIARITKFKGEGPLRVVISHENITERKQAEAALEASEKRFRTLIENSSDQVSILSANGELLYENPTATPMLGYAYGEHLGRDIFQLLHPDDAERMRSLFNWLVERPHQKVRDQFRLLHRDGTWRWMEAVGTNLLTEPSVGGIVVNYHDITERKQAEEALRESEERFRSYIQHASDLIFTLDFHGRITSANQALCETLGYSEAELEGMPALKLVAPEHRTPAAQALRHIWNGENLDTIEAPIQTRDGRTIIVQIRGRTVYKSGRLVETVHIARDITAQKHAERQVRRRVMELEALYQSGIAFSQTLDQKEIGEKIIEVLSGRLDWHHAAVRVRSGNGRDVELLAFSHARAEEDAVQAPSAITQVGQGMAGWVIEHGQSLRSDHLENDPRYVATYAGMKSGLYVPIRMFDTTVGCISVESEHEQAFTEDDERLLSTLAVQAAVALENARSYEAAIVSAQRLAVLYEAGQRIIHVTQNMEELYESIHHAVAQLMTAEAFTIVLRGEEQNELDAVYLFDKGGRWAPKRIPFGQGFSSRVISAGKTVRIRDTQETNLNAVHFGTEEVVRSILAVPLRIGDRVLGAISAQSYTPDAYTDEDQFLLEMLAVQTASALENAFMFKSIQRELGERIAAEQKIQSQLRRLNALREIDQAISSNFDLKVSLNVILSKAAKVLEVDASTILLLDPVNKKLEYASGAGFRSVEPETRSIAIQDSYAGRAVLEQRMVRIPDLREEPGNKFLTGFLKDEDFVSYACVPLIVKGQALGALEVFHRSVVDRDEEWFEFLGMLAGQAAIAIDNARLFSASRRELAERKHAEEELRRLNAELETRVAQRTADLSRVNSELQRALRVKDEFLASMSHELRTPLNSIIGLSESLEEQTAGPLNEKQRKYVNIINESGNHLLALINDILDIAKIESGQIALDHSDVNVRAVCQSGLRMINHLAMKKGLQVTFEADARLDTIWADERRIKQMLVNLLSNAVKFTPENGRVGLEARGNWNDGTVTFTVWDTGIGIRKKDLPRLFRPFVQLDSDLSRKASGTGLGLSLVAQMARLHGGSVSVESQPEVGSRFTITLPMEAPSTPEAVIRRRTTGRLTALDPAEEQKKRTILLMEDTEEVTAALSDFLEHEGCRVEIAKNGVDGIVRAKKILPDLILMDVQLPDMDSLEATRRLREEDTLKDTPIIALTALAISGDRERCLAAGMNEYLTKPVNLEQLAVLLHEFLRR